ncbi:MAG: HAMP domain-containing histidine kinase [Desulfamplus sp.]|nr:HAMP domain-containing histidine kinase [Desulfamplus sp.]
MMKNSKPLRSRIIRYFSGYLALLLIIYSAGITGMLKMSEDWAFNKQLSEIAESILKHFEQYGKFPTNLPMHITAYSDIQSVPKPLQKYVAHHEPDIFEIADDIDYHAAIILIPSTSQKLFIFYHVASIETTQMFQSIMTLAVAGISLVIFSFGWLIASSLSNRILMPISDLVRVVQSLALEEDSDILHSFKSRDELGMLSEIIKQLLKQISEFTRREREFTSHASHELRTPISVIKNAVEILNRRTLESDQSIKLPLARIERSVRDMEVLINTFLVLSRHRQNQDKDEIIDLKIVAEDIVNQHRYLLNSKVVEVDIYLSEIILIKAPVSLVRIAIGNLVRNAFQYTMKGKVLISLFSDRVSICDTGPGINHDVNGYDIGLTIVQRLCQSMNWQFLIADAPDGGTQADLIFPASQIVGIGNISGIKGHF